ncbi:MAG: DUF86 domain-containing protein [Acholeplasmatales bacterium]|nr:DUF86 domain-containing protein [Acholeplasmatales bacterium]
MDNIKNDEYFKKIIINDVDKIIQYSKDTSYDEFIENEELVDAILFRLIQISENIKKLSLDFRLKHSNVPWNEIIGFRNKIVHDYGQTDYSIVYEVVTSDIKALKDALK